MENENVRRSGEAAEGEIDVPAALRFWFVIHFAIDVIVALPIFLAPSTVLGLLGWSSVDPIAARLAAAALFGIGIESFLGRNAGSEAFRGMLQLKLIWSFFAAVGIAWSTVEGTLTYPIVGWLLVGTFVAFHLLWWYWLVLLNKEALVERG
jgi:hypothetical protein